jgi:hypothetical protein
MASHVLEVDGPEGRFVVRAEPRGISLRVWGLYWRWLLGCVRRLATRDHTWIIRIRARADDPLGTPICEDVVASRAQVGSSMATAERRIREGRVGPPHCTM